jgi:PTH1 family peptidyl-tRNA hydrolase
VSCTAIIGLGNPGAQYSNSRHNLGFWLLDKFAESQKINFIEKSKYCAEICKMSFQDKSFMLVKPITFMNESGKFLKSLLSSNNCELEESILVHDELTLPVGRMKISVGQGDGGHNGVKSVFSGIGQNLKRLRLGIGPKLNPDMDLANHVLSKFSSDEQATLEHHSLLFLNALKSLMTEGVEKAMNLYNQSLPTKI